MKTTHDINLVNYNEAAALQNLLWDIYSTRCAQDERCVGNNFDNEQITITVGGESSAFLLNDTVAAALHTFVKCVADENGYFADFEALVVADHE